MWLIQAISCEKKHSKTALITSSFQSSVRHDNYSNWLSVFITDLQNEKKFMGLIFIHNLATELQNALKSALLIFKMRVINMLRKK